MSTINQLLKYTAIVFAMSILFVGYSTAQSSKGKKSTVTVKTNTYCDHCKKCETCAGKMESELTYVKGIKYAEYNEDDMTISVTYNNSKISIDEIRKEISLLGFDADDVTADPKGYESLDNCCKK